MPVGVALRVNTTSGLTTSPSIAAVPSGFLAVWANLTDSAVYGRLIDSGGVLVGLGLNDVKLSGASPVPDQVSVGGSPAGFCVVWCKRGSRGPTGCDELALAQMTQGEFVIAQTEGKVLPTRTTSARATFRRWLSLPSGSVGAGSAECETGGCANGVCGGLAVDGGADAGLTDAGSSDGGEDAGTDAGRDAGVSAPMSLHVGCDCDSLRVPCGGGAAAEPPGATAPFDAGWEVTVLRRRCCPRHVSR
ncbi:MAG TPA: hypothetical protein VKJ07_24605, partial [Mycobacteriales bacterium]|nr:hypothetical protein [Mycobacteriales bacterium]